MQNIISNFESLSEEDISKYAGEWIAVINNKIVSHGESLKEVYESAKKEYPQERPLIGKLPDNIPVILSVV